MPQFLAVQLDLDAEEAQIEGADTGKRVPFRLLPDEHLWRADLMAFDDFTSYATAVRYPKPGGGMPNEPEDAELQSGWAEVSALIGEIEDWRKDKLD